MDTTEDSALLLRAIAAEARAVRSLYGPNKLRKQVTDEADQTIFSADAYVVASGLQSQNAGTAILQQALDEQRHAFGTGCTTMLTLCGVLAETVLKLQRQGLPTDSIQQALSSVEGCCQRLAKQMRLPLNEITPSFQELMWSRQLEVLGRLLSTDDRSIATSLAVMAGSMIDPIRFGGESDIPFKDLVTSHVVLGGTTSSSSSRVLGGVLLPIEEDAHRAGLRRRVPASFDGGFVIDGGVAIIAADLNPTDLPSVSSVQVVFVFGEVSTQTMDASASSENVAMCIPVSSYDLLRQLAAMSGAEIVDSIEELLPSAIGHECLQVKTFDLSVSRVAADDDNDEYATFFAQIVLPGVNYQPCASVLVRGPNSSLAVELRSETRKMICRLRNTLRSGYVIPGNGGFWCACAAAVALEAETQDAVDPGLFFTISRLAEPLNHLGVILLENAGGASSNDSDNASLFSRLARVRTVQNHFANGVQEVGASKFYSQYDFQSAEYSILSPKHAEDEPENEDGRQFHVDEYKSMNSAIQRTFRVLQVLHSSSSLRQFSRVDAAMAAVSALVLSAGSVSPKKTGMPPRRQASVPLDYSFMGLASLSEMQQHDPVGGTKKSTTGNTAAIASTGNDTLSSPTSVDTSPKLDASTSPIGAASSPKKRQVPVSLRVNNNKLSQLNDMHEALSAVFDYPEMLQWLDLSGNELTSIPPNLFSAYPDLFTLHLHGNLLSKYSDVDALARWLPRLHSLTLHGNPIDEKRHYRNYVIASFPNLKQLNFSSVTIGDRDKAETWARIYKNTRVGGGKGRHEEDP